MSAEQLAMEARIKASRNSGADARLQARKDASAALAAERRKKGIFTACELEEQNPHPVQVGTTYRFDPALKCDKIRDALSPSLLGAKVQLKKNGGDQGTCDIVAVNNKGLTCAGKVFGTRNAKLPEYDAFTIIKLTAGGKRRKTRKPSKRSKRTRRSRS